jgi:pyruvate-formate lyase
MSHGGGAANVGRPNESANTPDGRHVGAPIRDGDSVNIIATAQQVL